MCLRSTSRVKKGLGVGVEHSGWVRGRGGGMWVSLGLGLWWMMGCRCSSPLSRSSWGL